MTALRRASSILGARPGPEMFHVERKETEMFDRKKLRAQMVLKGISAKDLSKALNINESTFYRKLNDDGRFTREEMNIMIQVLEIEDPADIFFSQQLA